MRLRPCLVIIWALLSYHYSLLNLFASLIIGLIIGLIAVLSLMAVLALTAAGFIFNVG